MSVRRDDRAEPDDPAPAGRIDVVNVDAGGGRENNAVAAMLTLRRELTRLTAQATAVEESLEDQRRERSEALTRMQQATERATELEARSAQLEKELESLRHVHEVTLAELRNVTGERDDLAQSLDSHRANGEELARRDAQLAQRDEELAQRDEELARRDEAVRAAAEAAKTAEANAARTETELEGLKRRLVALEIGNQGLRTQAEEEEKRALAKDTDLAVMREKQGHLTRELETLKKEGLETAKRELSEANDRAADFERKASEANDRAADFERDLASVRAELERLRNQAAAAEQRALEEKIARAGIEQAIFKLRDDVLGAFSHLDEPKPLPVAVKQVSEMPATRAVHAIEIPPDARGVLPASSPPDAMSAMRDENVGPLDEGWTSNSDRPPVTVASPSVRPKSMRPSASPEMLASIHKSGSAPPPTRRPDSIVPVVRRAASVPTVPEAESHDYAQQRAALFARLADPDRAADAVSELRERPEWLRSVPPPALVTALGSVDYDVDNPVFDLARAWDREPLCHALVGAVRNADDERLREHGAWLLKHLAAPTQWKALADLARSEAEPVQVRRWLLEALDRLAAGRAIGWRELGDIVLAMTTHPDPTLRDGVVGILMSLERSDEKKKLLVEMLQSETDEGVILSLLHALGSVLPIEIDPAVTDRLLEHVSPRVQRSTRDLLDRSRQKH